MTTTDPDTPTPCACGVVHPTKAQQDASAARAVVMAYLAVTWWGGYRLGTWLRARLADAGDGGPPAFGRAGRTGYTDGYRDGLADATARSAAAP